MSSELILATTSLDGDIAIWDATRFHSITTTFKNNASDPRCTCPMGTAYIASCQKSSAKIRIWPRNKGACVESALPEKCSSLISSPDGLSLFAGGKSGRIHFWDLPSGDLLHSWQAHYKAVSIVKLDATGTLLASSSEDCMIHLWLISEVLDPVSNKMVTPFQSWSGHTLPVTDLEILSSLNELMIVSVSLDCSCQIWSVVSKGQLKSIVFPCPVLTLAVDRGQCTVFCGGQDGCIHETSLIELPTSQRECKAWDHSHSQPVTSLVVTCFSGRLVSGSLDGIVKVWDIGSKQCLTALEFPGKKPVSEVFILTSHNNEETPILKITGLSKFPKSSEDAWKGSSTILSGEVQYQGIAHQFLNPKAPITFSSQSGVSKGKQQDTKLALDVSEDAPIDICHATNDGTTPASLRTLVQQILQQDRTT